MSGDDILGYQFPDRGNHPPENDLGTLDTRSGDINSDLSLAIAKHIVLEAEHSKRRGSGIIADAVMNELHSPGGKLFEEVQKHNDACLDFLHGVSTETIQSGNLGAVVQEWLEVNQIKQSKTIRLAAGELTKAVKEMG